jgi:hypothetical protein
MALCFPEVLKLEPGSMDISRVYPYAELCEFGDVVGQVAVAGELTSCLATAPHESIGIAGSSRRCPNHVPQLKWEMKKISLVLHRDCEGEDISKLLEAVSRSVDVNNKLISKQQGESSHFINTVKTQSSTHPEGYFLNTCTSAP